MSIKKGIVLIGLGLYLCFVSTAFAFYANYEQLDVCLEKKIDGGKKRHCLRGLVVQREKELNYLSENEIPFKHDCWLSGYAGHTSQLVAKGIVKPYCLHYPPLESESVKLLACDQKKIKNGKKRHCYRDLVIQRESEFEELLSNYGANIEKWQNAVDDCYACRLEIPVEHTVCALSVSEQLRVPGAVCATAGSRTFPDRNMQTGLFPAESQDIKCNLANDGQNTELFPGAPVHYLYAL